MAENNLPEVTPGDIVSKHGTESTQKLVQKLGDELENAPLAHRETNGNVLKKPGFQKEIYSPKSYQSVPDNTADTVSVSTRFLNFAPRPVQS